MPTEGVQGLRLDEAARRIGNAAKPRSVYVLAAVLAGYKAVKDIARVTGYSERSVFRELRAWRAVGRKVRA